MNTSSSSSAAGLGERASARETTVPDFAPFSRGQIGYTAVVALLAWTFAVYDLITFGNLLPVI